MQAAADGQDEVVNVLLAAGADIGIAQEQLDRALVSAARNGQINVIPMLQNAGADSHANADSALCWAVKCNQQPMVLQLLEAGWGEDCRKNEQSVNEKIHTDFIDDLMLEARVDTYIHDQYGILWALKMYCDHAPRLYDLIGRGWGLDRCLKGRPGHADIVTKLMDTFAATTEHIPAYLKDGWTASPDTKPIVTKPYGRNGNAYHPSPPIRFSLLRFASASYYQF